MVAHLIGSYCFKPVNDLLLFSTNGNNLHKGDVQLVVNLLFITCLLKDSDLGRLRQVNRSWNLLILSTPKFVDKMLVSSLLFAARQTAQKIEDKWNMDLLLLRSFKIELRHDFSQAQERLKRGDVPFKTEALLEIAKIDPQHNFAPAKTHALAINDFRTRDKELTKIVELEAKYNLIDAKATAEAISSESGEKAIALLKIVQVEALSNIDDAKATAHAILETKYYDNNYVEAMTVIVKIEAQSNIEAAEATAKTIPSRDSSKADREILKKKAQTNFGNALKIAQKSVYLRENLMEVIKGCAQVDLAGAKAAALTFNPYLKDLALCEIVIIEVHVNLDAAKVTALPIKDPEIKERAVIAIAKKEVKVNFEVFKRSSYAISNRYVRQDLGMHMFKAEALTDLISANAKTLTIPDSQMKAKVILKIAKALLKNQSKN